MANVKKASIDYQALKAELDSVMNDLQNEDLAVDEALQLYQKGLELVQQLDAYLKTAENTVRELKAEFDKGTK